MPHRLSLVRRLALLRRLYTGETDSSLMPAAMTACQRMVAEERQLLLQALDRDYTQRLLGDDNAAPLPPALRSAVLPDAQTRAQQELEAAVLLAASRSRSYLHPWPGIAHWLTNRPSQLVRMMRPQPRELFLHLEAAVLAPLMLELLPRITETGTVAGLPGLRATLHRRHVELFVLGTEPPARVQLANVSYRAWSAALAFAEAAYPEQPDPLRWLGNDPAPLLPQELEALAGQRLAGDLTALASWLLRRLRLLGQTQQLNVSVPEPNQLQVRWSGGSTAAATATKLVHPITGLRGDRFLVVPAGSSITIHCLDSDVSVELCSTPSSGVSLAPLMVDVVGAWRAWEQQICARSQWSDQFWAKQGLTEAPLALVEPLTGSRSDCSESSRPLPVGRAE